MKMLSVSILTVALLAGSAPAQTVSMPCCKCLGTAPDLVRDISTGQTSPNDLLWTVNNGVPKTSNPVNGNWATTFPTGWIEPATVQSNTTYTYKLVFNVPNCTIPMGVRLDGKYAADNSAVASLDGGPIASCAGPDCFSSSGGQAPVSFSVTSISPGTHVLQFDVTNGGGISGLIVKATLKTHCRSCEPCPILGSYDGANCFIGTPPSGTNAFIFANNFYYTPLPGNQCPRPGSWYDGANCFVMPIPSQTTPFIWANSWYVVAPCTP
jgi:hypothetical protein